MLNGADGVAAVLKKFKRDHNCCYICGMLDTLLNSLYLEQNKLKIEIGKLEQGLDGGRSRRHEPPGLVAARKRLAGLVDEEEVNSVKLRDHLNLDAGYRVQLNAFRDFAQCEDAKFAAERREELEQLQADNPIATMADLPAPAFKSRDSIYVAHYDGATNPNIPKARKQHTLDDLTKYRMIFMGDYDMVHHWKVDHTCATRPQL